MDGGELKRRFGLWVQELREAKGLTQEQLAALIGRSVDTVSNIERGVNATQIETAYQIAAQLGVPMQTLFDLEDAPRAAGRERQRAVQSVLELLENTEPATITRLKELVEVGSKLARRA